MTSASRGKSWKVLHANPITARPAVQLICLDVMSFQPMLLDPVHIPCLVVTPMKWPKLIFVLMGSIQTCVVEHGYLEST